MHYHHPMMHKHCQKISSLMTRFLLLSVSTSTLFSAVSSKSLDPHVIALKTSLLFAEEEGTQNNTSRAPVNQSVDVTAAMQMQMQPTTTTSSPDFLQISSTSPSNHSQSVTIADETTIEQVNTTTNSSSIEIETRDDNVLSETESNDQASPISNDEIINKALLSSSADSVTNVYNDEASILSQASQEIGTCKCGVLPPTDDSDSQRNEFPWSGALFHRTQNNNDTSGPPDLLMFCGAVLISDRHALTTSRCVSGIPPSELEVWFSEDKIWSDQKPSKAVHKSKVGSVLIHPKFDRKLLNHEIALLKLSSAVDFSSSNKISGRATTIVPICLPLPTWNSDMSSYSSENATLSSWEKKGRTSYTLFKSVVPIISNEECMSVANKSPVLRRRNDLYNSSLVTLNTRTPPNISPIKVNENMICAGDVENGTPESCDTDTGSPLVVDDINGGDGDGRKTLVGLVSWLYGCTSQEELSLLYNIIFSDDTQHPQVPGVYTRITSYYSWIMENTLDAQWCSG